MRSSMKPRVPIRLLIGAIVVALCGCGLIELERTLFPNQASAPDGSPLFVEDIEDITGDNTLLPADMEDALRNLGLGSEDLINAIVDDGLNTTTLPTPPSNGNGNANRNGNDNGA